MSLKIFSFLFILIIASACSSKKAEPNASFRERIIAKMADQNEISKFDTLLNTLDKNDLSFCQFVQKIFKLDDSCYSVAKKKYPDIENEDDFVKLHLQLTKEAELKYMEHLKLDINFAAFATTTYNLDSNIKSFCGN